MQSVKVHSIVVNCLRVQEVVEMLLGSTDNGNQLDDCKESCWFAQIDRLGSPSTHICCVICCLLDYNSIDCILKRDRLCVWSCFVFETKHVSKEKEKWDFMRNEWIDNFNNGKERKKWMNKNRKRKTEKERMNESINQSMDESIKQSSKKNRGQLKFIWLTNALLLTPPSKSGTTLVVIASSNQGNISTL